MALGRHARFPTVMLDSRSCYNTRLFPRPGIDLPVAADLGDAKLRDLVVKWSPSSKIILLGVLRRLSRSQEKLTVAYELGSLGLCRGPGVDCASVTVRARSSSGRASA